MELWGLGNQPWQEEGFTINVVAAMPKGSWTPPSFTGKELILKGPGEVKEDKIELHYIAFSDDEKPHDGQDVVHFDTSLAGF